MAVRALASLMTVGAAEWLLLRNLGSRIGRQNAQRNRNHAGEFYGCFSHLSLEAVSYLQTGARLCGSDRLSDFPIPSVLACHTTSAGRNMYSLNGTASTARTTGNARAPILQWH